MKILILGHAGSGKDEAAKMIAQKRGLFYASTSWLAMMKAVYPAIAKYEGYTEYEDCWRDKANKRKEWRWAIKEYNREDPAILVREVLEVNDFYVGLRDPREYEASKHLFDAILYINAYDRVPKEGTMGIEFDPCTMEEVFNGGDLEELEIDISFLLREWKAGRTPRSANTPMPTERAKTW